MIPICFGCSELEIGAYARNKVGMSIMMMSRV